MARVVEIRRYLPHEPTPAALAQARERQEALSVRILLWGFLTTAVVLCAIVATALAKTWLELLIFSGILVIFVLTKIFLANALFYMMMHYDTDGHAAPPAPARRNVLPFRGGRRELVAALTRRGARQSAGRGD